MATDLETKRKTFLEKLEGYRVQPASFPDRANAICAAVDYVHTALERYIESAAADRDAARQDREAAAKDRASAAQDREQQKADRTTMNRLTFVIALATIGTVAGPCITARLTARSADTSPVAGTSP